MLLFLRRLYFILYSVFPIVLYLIFAFFCYLIYYLLFLLMYSMLIGMLNILLDNEWKAVHYSWFIITVIHLHHSFLFVSLSQNSISIGMLILHVPFIIDFNTIMFHFSNIFLGVVFVFLVRTILLIVLSPPQFCCFKKDFFLKLICFTFYFITRVLQTKIFVKNYYLIWTNILNKFLNINICEEMSVTLKNLFYTFIFLPLHSFYNK